MVDAPTPYEALLDAVEALGSQAELARICEVSPTAVWKWMQSSKRLPAEHVLKVEVTTGVSRHLLRPDIYPRGLVDGVPFSDQEPDLFAPVLANARDGGMDGRDQRASDDGERFNGIDRRASQVLA